MHFNCGENSMLIQIADPTGWMPTPKFDFKFKYQFRFADVEVGDELEKAGFGITDEDAKQIVVLLQYALDNRMNVVVHCMAGICRSGAVVEVATMMGFGDCCNYRQPNIMVKQKLMQVLGWSYGEERDGKIYSGD